MLLPPRLPPRHAPPRFADAAAVATRPRHFDMRLLIFHARPCFDAFIFITLTLSYFDMPLSPHSAIIDVSFYSLSRGASASRAAALCAMIRNSDFDFRFSLFRFRLADMPPAPLPAAWPPPPRRHAAAAITPPIAAISFFIFFIIFDIFDFAVYYAILFSFTRFSLLSFSILSSPLLPLPPLLAFRHFRQLPLSCAMLMLCRCQRCFSRRHFHFRRHCHCRRHAMPR
jgi:hypothetical protein